MQHAYQMKTASEITAIDSTASCNANNQVITLVLAASLHVATPAVL